MGWWSRVVGVLNTDVRNLFKSKVEIKARKEKALGAAELSPEATKAALEEAAKKKAVALKRTEEATKKKAEAEAAKAKEKIKKKKTIGAVELPGAKPFKFSLDDIKRKVLGPVCDHAYILQKQVWRATNSKTYELKDEVICSKCNHKTIRSI